MCRYVGLMVYSRKLIALVLALVPSLGQAQDTPAYCQQNAQNQYLLPPQASEHDLNELDTQLQQLHQHMQHSLQQSLEGFSSWSAQPDTTSPTASPATTAANTTSPPPAKSAGSTTSPPDIQTATSQPAKAASSTSKHTPPLKQLYASLLSVKKLLFTQATHSSLEWSQRLQSYFELLSHYEWLALIHKPLPSQFQHHIEGLQLEFSNELFAKVFPSSSYIPINAERHQHKGHYRLHLARPLSYLNWQHALAKNKHMSLSARYLESIKCRLQIAALQHRVQNLLFAEQSIDFQNLQTKACQIFTPHEWAEAQGLQASIPQKQKAQIISALPHMASQNIEADAKAISSSNPSALDPQIVQNLLSMYYPKSHFKFQLLMLQEEWEAIIWFYELSNSIDPLGPYVMALKNFMNQQLQQAYQHMPLFQMGPQLVQLPEVKSMVHKLTQGCGYSLNDMDTAEALQLLAQLADLLFVAELQTQSIQSPLEFNTPQDLHSFLIEVRTQSLGMALQLLMSESLSGQQNFTAAQALQHFQSTTHTAVKNYVTQRATQSKFAEQVFQALGSNTANMEPPIKRGDAHRRPRGYPAAHNGSGRAHLIRSTMGVASLDGRLHGPVISRAARRSPRVPAQQHDTPYYIAALHKAALEIKNIETMAENSLPFNFQAMLSTIQPERTGLEFFYEKNINSMLHALYPIKTHHQFWATHFKPHLEQKNYEAQASCQRESTATNLYNAVAGWFSSARQAAQAATTQCLKVHRVIMALQLHQQEAPNTLEPVLHDVAPYYSSSELKAFIQNYRHYYALMYYSEFPLLKQYLKAPRHATAMRKSPSNLYDSIKNKIQVDNDVVQHADRALQQSLQSANTMFHAAVQAQTADDLNNYILHTRLVEDVLGQQILEQLAYTGTQQSLAWSISTPSNTERYNTYFRSLVEPELLSYHVQQKENKIDHLYASAQARDEFKINMVWMWMGFSAAPWVLSKLRFWPRVSSLFSSIRQRSQWMRNSYSQVVTALFTINLIDQQIRVQNYSKKRTLINNNFSMNSLNNQEIREAYLAQREALLRAVPSLGVHDYDQQNTEFSNRIGNFNVFSGNGGARSEQLFDAILIAFPAVSLSRQGFRHLRKARQARKAGPQAQVATAPRPPKNLSPKKKQKLEKKLLKKIDRFKIESRRSFTALQVDPTQPMAFNLSHLQAQHSKLVARYASRPLKKDAVQDAYKNIVLFVGRLTQGAPVSLQPALSRKLFQHKRIQELQRYIDEAARLGKSEI